MIDILTQTVFWGPTVIWLLLTVVGLYFGYKELHESGEDVETVEEDRLNHIPIEKDPRMDVAKGNFNIAWKNMLIQSMFLVVGVVGIFLRIYFYSQFEEVNIIRNVIVPPIVLVGEALLVSQLIGMSRTRKKVNDKSRDILLEKQVNESRGESEGVVMARARNEEMISKGIEQSEKNITNERAERELKIVKDRADSEVRVKEDGL